MTYKNAEEKYYEYLEANNKKSASRYKKIMDQLQEQETTKLYYETRIKDLLEFIKNKGLYEQLQLFLNRKDCERCGEKDE